MSVRRILSACPVDSGYLPAHCSAENTHFLTFRRQKKLDKLVDMDIIIFTGDPEYDLATRPPAKAPNPPPAWHAQSATRIGYSPAVSKQRFLRSGRPAAGQVRDAPPGSRGSAIH